MNSLRFTLTPPRMRMIVEAFKEALELGLEKADQVVVCMNTLSYLLDIIWLADGVLSLIVSS